MKMNLKAMLCCLPFVLLLSCGEKKEFGTKDTIVKESAMTVTDVLKPVNYDRPVKIRGIVTKVCQTEGCWMAIKDEKNSKIRVTFKDGTFAVPMNSAGKQVSMEGMVVAEVVDGETATIWMSNIDSIVPISKSDQRIPVFIASSVTFE